ncbi:MAG TPA: hypothetical protein VF006_07045 [Longimicrobium sp.]
MTHPQYRLARRIPTPPDAVLAALRAAVAATQRRDIPPPLRKGVRGMRGKVRGQRFTVALEYAGEGGPGTNLVGMVVPVEGGGSEVRASARDGWGAPNEALVLLGGAGVLALTGNGGVAWMLAGVAALVAIITTFRQATGLIHHDEAAFLLDWLNAVLGPPAPADPGATVDPAERVSSPS